MNAFKLPAAPVSVFIALALSFQSGIAGDAFFSKDGRTVTIALCNARSGLLQVDIASGKITEAPLPQELKDECIESVARGGDGEALFLAKDAVWVWTPGAATPVKRVYSTAPVVGAADLFVVTQSGTPLTDCLFVSGNEAADASSAGTFYGRKPGSKGKAFVSVFCRRVGNATGGVFSDDGRLFFLSDGDVWEGGIQTDDDDAGLERLGTLVGARIAPLAISNTDEANGGGQWVHHIAPAGNWIYALLRGRHMATIVRTPMPARPLYAPSSDDFPTVKAQLEAMAQSLTKTEILIEDLDDTFGFCATEIGGRPRVFYCTRTDAEGKGPGLMLWEGTGKARAIGHFSAD
ncbi:hypothetical protein [Prosthecobacter sp.]|uniref:hypothetical protein n=1 Tax=Prosthecobacter sp. TaxID=1965333 RepID=UPI001D70C86B|nr:hypothetical protein [Prosthecobacter sp.]MCB1276156.1 hypothetical protein [Prosthecobacter sp.]